MHNHKAAAYEPIINPKKTAFNVDFGSIAGTAAQGNDSRFSDQRTPTDGSVTYQKIGTEFKYDLQLSGSHIDWSTGFYCEVTLTANTTFTFANLQKGKTIIIRMTGAFTPTFPGSCELVNSGSYNGTKFNYLVLTCVNSVTPKVLMSINKTA